MVGYLKVLLFLYLQLSHEILSPIQNKLTEVKGIVTENIMGK